MRLSELKKFILKQKIYYLKKWSPSPYQEYRILGNINYFFEPIISNIEFGKIPDIELKSRPSLKLLDQWVLCLLIR